MSSFMSFYCSSSTSIPARPLASWATRRSLSHPASATRFPHRIGAPKKKEDDDDDDFTAQQVSIIRSTLTDDQLFQ